MTQGDERTPAPYDALGEAKRLLRSIRSGALATLGSDGHPFATLVNVATDVDGSPLLLVSKLALHTRYLEADGRCSILLAQTGKGDPLAHPRLTMSGRAEPVSQTRARNRFLRRHPKSALYADFPDFRFWRATLESAHLNGGFGKAGDFGAAAVLTDLSGAEDLVAAEEAALEHLNADHAEALRLYATRLAGEADGPWRATGIDPEGLDLMLADKTARIVFPNRVATPGTLRKVLKDLAEEARAASA
jgi:putative heme iron utilization protein